jgi:hypothetical protein
VRLLQVQVQVQQQPRSPPEWQRRPTWASEWAAQHVMRSAAAQQDGGFATGGGGGSGESHGSSRSLAGGSGDIGGGSSMPMHSRSYLQQQERRYINVGV